MIRSTDDDIVAQGRLARRINDDAADERKINEDDCPYHAMWARACWLLGFRQPPEAIR